MLLLAGVAVIAVWRASEDRQRHHSLEHTSSAVISLQRAHAQFLEGLALVNTLVWTQDPALVDMYRLTAAELQQELSLARGHALHEGEIEYTAALDNLSERLDRYDEEAQLFISAMLEGTPQGAAQVARARLPQDMSEVEAILGEFERLDREEETHLAGAGAAADRASDITLVFFVALGAAAFAGGTVVMLVLVLSVVRPLGLLQASARAIASGDLEARAEVSGPEEVASLARDFNKMVAERKRAEEKTREQSEFLENTLNSLGHPFCVIDAQDYTIKMANAAARVDRSPTGSTCYELTHRLSEPCSGRGQVCPLEEVKKTKAPVTAEHVHRGRDGQPKVYEIHCHPVFDAEGNVRQVIEYNLDITERKQAEEALRRQQEEQRTILDSVPGLIFYKDRENRFVRVNKALVESLGVTREEAEGGSAFDLFPEHAEEYWRDDLEVMESGRAKTDIVEPVETPAGTKWFRTDKIPYVDENGDIVGIIGFSADITEFKRAEEALRESEAKYRSIFENVQDIFYRTDATGIITEISPSVERYGYTREGMIGTQVLDVYADAEERAALLKAVLERGEVVDYEIHLKTGDGRVIETSVSTHVFRGPDGSFAGVEGALRDITERKRAEQALREQVRRDPLTGALNHLAIVDELRGLISDDNGACHVVAMVDVDGLKAINDTYGHQVGDTVLVTVATALSRDGALVGRYGGDEFTALLPGADRAAGERYREEVLDALADVELRDPETGARVPVVASIGLASYPTEAGRLEELIKAADSAMYAWRRQRPVGSPGQALARALGGDRAAKMVGEIVPLLTSPGDLQDKLRLVAHRLSVGAGYDAVNFQVFRDPSEAPVAQNVFARVPDEVIERWTRSQRQATDVPIRRILERTRRPIIIDDPQHDPRLTETQREVLRAAGLQSALIAPMIWRKQLIGHLSVASKREGAFGPRDAEFLMAVATQVTTITRTATLVDELQSASERLVQAQAETVMLLAAAAEARDHATGLHLQNVRAIAEALALELGSSQEDAAGLGLAAVLHDIGKIRVPDLVLSTAGELTDEEWGLIRQHTVWGGEFLAGRPGFEMAVSIARSHHERWDGGGYPDGLSGDGIPEAATIVAVADAFDAMITDRPYRARRSVAAAVREIRACSGKQFSPKVVQVLRQLHKAKVLSRLRQPKPEEKAAA